MTCGNSTGYGSVPIQCPTHHGSLPFTGLSVIVIVIVALVLVGLGVLMRQLLRGA